MYIYSSLTSNSNDYYWSGQGLKETLLGVLLADRAWRASLSEEERDAYEGLGHFGGVYVVNGHHICIDDADALIDRLLAQGVRPCRFRATGWGYSVAI